MNPLATSLLTALATAIGDPPTAVTPGAPGVTGSAFHPLAEAILAAAGHGGLLTALFGCALLAFMLAPERNRLAAVRVASHPLMSFAIGALLLLPALLLLGWILHHSESRHGRGVLAIYLLAANAAGLATCARALGERACPGRAPLLLVAAGLLALILPLASPLGAPALFIAAPLGLGGLVSAGRGRPSSP